MDGDLEQLLQWQVKIFNNHIKHDYWDYVTDKCFKEKYGFQCFDVCSNEFKIESFFRKRFENYFRRDIVNAFFEKALDYKGNGVYPCHREEYDAQIYDNYEFESQVAFEFTYDSIVTNKRVGIRYCDISESFFAPDDIDEIIIINWDKLCETIDDNVSFKLNSGVIVRKATIYTFLVENGFTEEEYNQFIIAAWSAVQDYRDLLGVKTIPNLSPRMLFNFRFDVEHSFKDYIKKMYSFIATDEKVNTTYPELIDDFTWAYHIIYEDNKNKYPKIENTSKQIIKKALPIFEERKLYKALLFGKNDFSRAFLTAEYLYNQFDSDDQFDYTSIVSGYLKSVEQLLFYICSGVKDQGFKIKSSGKRMDDGNKLPYKVDFTEENLAAGLCDTTLGALSYLLKESKRSIIHDKTFKVCLFECLQCFIKECRNDSFHKDNIDKWSKVEYIRKNTIVIIIILLALGFDGSSIIAENITKQIVDDSYERVYKWITSLKGHNFFIEFDGVEHEVKMVADSIISEFTGNGMIKDYMFWLECVNERDPVSGKPERVFIKRDYKPRKMWFISNDGMKNLFSVDD